MKLYLPSGPLVGEIDLPISKSIANRYVIISALAGSKLSLSEDLPEDVRILQEALNSDSSEINIGMAGTAMRFLTAFYAVQEGKTVVLTGAERMKQRPIAELVDALRNLDAEIEYVENEGFPPLKIAGKKLKGGEVDIPASVSSQFVSALMMIGPMMENGLQIHLKGKVLSRPYIELTADCMRNCGVGVTLDENLISIPVGTYKVANSNIESDWTAASYFYALAAVRPNSKFLLKELKLNSPQGDSILANWFERMGVSSLQKENGVEITSSEALDFSEELDFINHPDLAQTFAFLAVTLGKSLRLSGLDNLRLKETDRVLALKSELEKLGISVLLEGNSMNVSGSISVKEVTLKTYNDHRMAMAASVLSTVIATEIEDPDVVTKSFPGFWSAFKF
ncbi:MAG: 3-phosphoshikimate 1-carboxyvinyltransferase [Flavobacteriales bacterium]|nr:3-phosphoshikimate 1-carboxyvinyltransferase [Flavobacteriales bacterium]